MSDGPSGVRGATMMAQTTCVFMPAPVCLGASWSRAHASALGRLIARECRSKSASIFLGPTVCLQRGPLGGRNFEAYSEDPVLTATLATRVVSGIQADGDVAATVKHL